MGDSICILPRVEGVGGPASFRARLIAGLQERGVSLVENANDPACSSILVIGGTRRVLELVRARNRGVRIVQRLNGMNWMHRKKFTGVRHFLRSEVNNRILSTIRARIAHRIVYQSNFARTWWQTVYGKVSAAGSVAYNGVDLQTFHPNGPEQPPADRYRILLVEGHFSGGYELGLFNAVDLVRALKGQADRPVELMVAGEVPTRLRARCEARAPGLIRWTGIVPRAKVVELDRSSHVLFSADLNAACPNSVIEALACGLPVVSYATGSIPELIEGEAGMVVPWGSNFWKLEPPDISMLASATLRIFAGQELFRKAARARAEAAFGLDKMVERYLEVLLGY